MIQKMFQLQLVLFENLRRHGFSNGIKPFRASKQEWSLMRDVLQHPTPRSDPEQFSVRSLALKVPQKLINRNRLQSAGARSRFGLESFGHGNQQMNFRKLFFQFSQILLPPG